MAIHIRIPQHFSLFSEFWLVGPCSGQWAIFSDIFTPGSNH